MSLGSGVTIRLGPGVIMSLGSTMSLGFGVIIRLGPLGIFPKFYFFELEGFA